MEPFGKKGTFVGYSESSKAYRIYELGERHIELNRDVTFHEEATFNRLKQIPYDTDTEENETPMSDDPETNSPHLDF